MIRYYLPSEDGDVEVSEPEWRAVMGDKIAASFACLLVKEEIEESRIPKDCRESVRSILRSRIPRYGRWVELEATAWRGATEIAFVARFCE